MKKNLIIALLFTVSVLFMVSCGDKYKYESVPNDPLNTRIYTLDNGMKVYLSVNKDKPRIQTYIGVRVGGKNDPSETTGLAHYLEHLLFKGTKHFGTTDYAAEEPFLNQIEALYETYRQTDDMAERKAIYAQIDSISQLAAAIAIPNEYDKLMSAIGAQGTNAFTSYDVTAYEEDIPANEIENWAMIQADRFKNPVLRLFHTELETVYEEYNRSLTSDGRKVREAMFNGLYPHHPYGKQTVLGSQEHLKNPSITNIKNFLETYYVPNNMAVCMAGDFDPDKVIEIIDKYFGDMQRKDVPELKTDAETPISSPVVKEVVGLEAENITIAFRTPGANTKDAVMLELIDYILTNGKAGLIDLNLNQKQKMLRAGSYAMNNADYGALVLYGTPKAGQTLDEAKELLLGQLDVLKKGEFDEKLLAAVINNFKLNQYYQMQEPSYAARVQLNAFVYNINWEDEVNKVDYQSKLTKQDIVDFCNKSFNDNYVVVYKKQGAPSDEKIDKPSLTPIPTNRNSESQFLADIKAREVTPIEPVFVDYSKDLDKLKAKNDIEVLYKQNTTNPLFSMYYVFEMGNKNDKALGTAFQYLNYLGTSTKTAEEIKSELYDLACSFGVNSTSDRVYVYISGLSENFDKAMALLEDRLADAQVDMEAYKNLSMNVLKSRMDAKANQSANFQRLMVYTQWGPKSPVTNILSEKELNSMNPQVLVDKIKSLKEYQHTIMYYGPLAQDELLDKLNKNHAVADQLKAVPEAVKFVEQETKEPKVYVANYDAKQILMAAMHKGGKYDASIEPVRQLYNEYFGGGMNSIVFQEMREARALAYTAWAGYSSPSDPEYSYYLSTYIGTQTDKMTDATDAFNEILNNLPQSEKAFDIAKENIITRIRTERVLREDILWSYMNAKKWNRTEDTRKAVFEKVPTLTLGDVTKFQEEYIKNKPLTYSILGNTKDINMGALNKIGKVTMLKQDEIFGY
ncbi:pitrilysin family protein [Dysgonomonas sp. 25]|uniref:M16 family metallopeptidase n=1 Tax=Dysgonomonas sp. 25 TaxID=2302933 RepID=UPI0013D75BBC|nr:insulinase family protein [Dysgonomonas sp. 25]NDV68237.1 insulinase family protein [Dysgonomonas sp. 25]